jgi:transcriptional regulator with XRE-family HTH domain
MARSCERCGANLARDNAGRLCSPCQRLGRAAATAPPTEPFTFGARLRDKRERANLSRPVLAGRIGKSAEWVKKLEYGALQMPKLPMLQHLAAALSTTVAELTGEPSVMAPPPIARPGLQTVCDIDLDNPLNAVQIRHLSQHLVALDGIYGGDDVYRIGVRAFRKAQRALESGAVRTSRDLEAAVGELGEVAGWLAYDADRQELARQMTHEALFISRVAGDRSMELFELSELAMQDIYLNQPREALRIADEVIENNRLAGRVQALFWLRRGRALAQLGDRPRAFVAMHRARSQLAEGIGSDDPQWTWWLTDRELDWHDGMVLANLGDWQAAVDAFWNSAQACPENRPRTIYNDLGHLTEGLVQVQAWSEAERAFGDVLRLAVEVGSARTERLLHRVVALVGAAGPTATSTVQDMAQELGRLLRGE